MNGHATARQHAYHEESLVLLDEKALSDIESECGRAEIERRFPISTLVKSTREKMGFLRARTWTSWRHVLARTALFLLPSFLQSRLARQQNRPEKLTPTSYLDGMRGLAALVVFFCHYLYQGYVVADSYGSSADNKYLFKLPFIRLLYQGPPAVCLFFVISGYALSYKPLKLMRSGQFDTFAVTMSSMTFRRIIRLYLPTTLSTFMIVVLLRLGVYEWSRNFAEDHTYLRNMAEPHPPRLESSSAQLTHWAWSMFNFVHVFGWEKYGGSTGYDVHLWTIPVEFRCSMYLFAMLMAVARLRTRMRITVMLLAMAFIYRNSRWELLLFLCGTVIAEMDIIRGAHVQHPVLPSSGGTPGKGRRRSAAWAALSVMALYLMSQPDVAGADTPGWRWLTSAIPEWWTEEQYRYWQSVGAVLFVVCVSHSPQWQRLFNAPVVQYLGKISYALYLMHGPVIHTLGYMWERRAFALTGVEGHWYDVGFALGAVGVVPSVLWAADVFWRLCDVPTVKFARWLEDRCLATHA